MQTSVSGLNTEAVYRCLDEEKSRLQNDCRLIFQAGKQTV